MIINVWTSSVDLNLDDHKRPRKPLLWQLGRQGVPKIGCFRKVVVVFPGAVVNKRRSPHVFYQFLNMLICPGKGRFLAVCHLDKTDVIFSYKRVGSAARQPQKIRSQRQSNAVAAAAPQPHRAAAATWTHSLSFPTGAIFVTSHLAAAARSPHGNCRLWTHGLTTTFCIYLSIVNFRLITSKFANLSQ